MFTLTQNWQEEATHGVCANRLVSSCSHSDLLKGVGKRRILVHGVYGDISNSSRVCWRCQIECCQLETLTRPHIAGTPLFSTVFVDACLVKSTSVSIAASYFGELRCDKTMPLSKPIGRNLLR